MKSISLQDSFGRPHDYLRVSLTERCNFRCTYCMPEEGIDLSPSTHLMSTDELLSILETFVELGVRKVRLTGGEPLVRKDIANVIERIAKLPVKLGITTNGVLIDRYFDNLKAAGVKSINISLDTLKKERFEQITRRNAFDKVKSNIQLILNEGLDLKINMVVMRGKNDDEVYDFVEWTRTAAIHLRFIEFMPFDGNKWDWDKVVSYKEILNLIQAKYTIVKLNDKPNSTSKGYRVEGFQGTFGVISSMTDHFCSSCNRLRLTADGKMKNCLFSNDEEDLLKTLRSGQNLKKYILDSIQRKKFRHGGNDFDKSKIKQDVLTNRSMISIGG